MWSPERKVPRFKWLSSEHAFSCSNILYKHYRTFTDHRPQPKTVAKLKRGHRFISRQGLRPLSTESQTSGTFQRKAHQWWTRGTHSSADRKNYSNKPVNLLKVQEKIRRNQESSCEKRIIELCEHIFRAFPSLPREIALSSSPCLTSHSSVRDSTCGKLRLPVISLPGSFATNQLATNQLATKIFILYINTEVDDKF